MKPVGSYPFPEPQCLAERLLAARRPRGETRVVGTAPLPLLQLQRAPETTQSRDLYWRIIRAGDNASRGLPVFGSELDWLARALAEVADGLDVADYGISGASVINRPGIGKLMEDARAGNFRIVLVERLDRLSRIAVAG